MRHLPRFREFTIFMAITPAILGLLYLWLFFSSDSGDRLVSARFWRWIEPFSHSQTLETRPAIVEFAFCSISATIISHSILLTAYLILRKRIFQILIKSIDYLRYTGAAVSLIFLAASAQYSFAEEKAIFYKKTLKEYKIERIDRLKSIKNHCILNKNKIESNINSENETEKSIKSICKEIISSEILSQPQRRAYESIINSCEKFGTSGYSTGEGPFAPEVLNNKSYLLSLYSSISYTCYLKGKIPEYESKIKYWENYLNSSKFSSDNKLFSYYISFLAMILGIRISKTTFEVIDAAKS